MQSEINHILCLGKSLMYSSGMTSLQGCQEAVAVTKIFILKKT